MIGLSRTLPYSPIIKKPICMTTLSTLPEVHLSKNIASALLAPDRLRVIVFEREGGYFFIDQHLHQARPGYIYVVPPTHSYYMNLESTGNIMCIDVPFAAMTPDCKSIILYCKNMPSKEFLLQIDDHYYQTLESNFAKGACHVFCDELLTPLSKSVKAGLTDDRSINTIYMDIASRFLEVFNQSPHIRSINAAIISQTLNVHKQTLQRAFRQMLNSTIKQVIDQQVISQAVALLAAPSMHFHSISSIADHLQFYSESDFARYFKKRTGFQPTQFRKYLQEQTCLKAVPAPH